MILDAFELKKEEKYLIDDCVNQTIDLFFKGEKSNAYTTPSKADLQKYCRAFCSKVNSIAAYSNNFISARIFLAQSPLTIVKFNFVKRGKGNKQIECLLDNDIKKILNKLDKYTFSMYRKSLFASRVMKLFDGDDLYIIKPSEKRHWSRSVGLMDANEVITNILGN